MAKCKHVTTTELKTSDPMTLKQSTMNWCNDCGAIRLKPDMPWTFPENAFK